MFNEAYEWVQSNDVEALMGEWLGISADFFNMGPCNQGYHAAEVKLMMDFLHNFYQATERQQVCQAFSAYQMNTNSLWDNMCDNMQVVPSIAAWLGDDSQAMVMDMVKFLTTYGELWSEYQLPNCPRQMHSSFHCEQYYNNPTVCGMRKAWLCDYAEWKETFLSDWLQEFTRVAGDDVFSMMGMQMPMCDNYDMSNMCKNSRMQRCFNMPVTGCMSCYCADHEYKDYRGLTAVWRKDYYSWRQVMYVYKQTFSNGMGDSMSSTSCDDDNMNNQWKNNQNNMNNQWQNNQNNMNNQWQNNQNNMNNQWQNNQNNMNNQWQNSQNNMNNQWQNSMNGQMGNNQWQNNMNGQMGNNQNNMNGQFNQNMNGQFNQNMNGQYNQNMNGQMGNNQNGMNGNFQNGMDTAQEMLNQMQGMFQGMGAYRRRR